VCGNLVKHRYIHTGNLPFICAHCGRGFTSRGNLVTHLLTHSGKKHFECEMWEKIYSKEATG
jgi:KRAB domain-containing zinc finger protein